MAQVDCSIVFPLLNESENIINAYNVIGDILKKEKMTYEIIYVDDGSTDNSAEIIKGLCQKDKNVKLISFSRNFGQQKAIIAGLSHAKGKCVINMDIDLQEDPSIIPQMLKEWKNGYEIVTIKRKKRKEGLIKKLTAKMYFCVLKLLGVKSMDNLADFRLLDQKVIDVIIRNSGHNVHLKYLVSNVGFKCKTLEADRNQRQFGKTKYNLKKMFAVASNGIASSTNKPLFLAFSLSIITGFVGVAGLIAMIILTCLKISFDSVLWLLPAMAIFTAIILLCIGFVGMYLAYTYDEVRGRDVYIVKEKVNIND